MSEPIFTIDLHDDEDICARIIERTLEELTDDTVEKLRAYALYECANMTALNLLSARSISNYAVANCSALTKATMPLVETIGARGFEGCRSLKELRLPAVRSIDIYGFAGCNSLSLVLNNPDVMCSVGGVSALGAKNYYAPRAFLSDTNANSDYRRATNWSAVADRFRVLEDWTDDGTITGALVVYSVSNKLSYVTTTNRNSETGPRASYSATLTANTEIEKVSITMGGVDITAEVYNAETGEINIPLVTGDLVITAKAEGASSTAIVSLTPYDGSEVGYLPYYRMSVFAGQKFMLTYYLTRAAGYLYDGRDCGLSYSLGNNVVNAETTETITIASDGIISFSSHRNDAAANGDLGKNESDRLYGKYLIVEEIL